MNKCQNCATPVECAAVGYDCGHDDELKTELPSAPSPFGDVIITRIYNPALGRDDHQIASAPVRTLMADTFVDEAFNQPSPVLFGQILVWPVQLFVVLNGRNRQVRYKLTRHRQHEPVWEAELVDECVNHG